MIHQADDFKSIASRCQEIRLQEHGPNALPPLPLSFGAALDSWAKLFELERTYGENDEALRGRVQSRIP